MGLATITVPEYLEAKIQADLEKGRLQAVEGTLQRVNYGKRELTVVAQGRIWYFTLAADCQLWFDDKQAILRCFHPLDQVRVIFSEEVPVNIIKAIYAWEK
jgi:hypothetical protein